MAKAHSLELRKRAVALVHSGLSQAKSAAEIKTLKTFVQNVFARYELTGSVLPSEKRGHRGRSLTPEQLEWLRGFSAEEPDLTTDRARDRLNEVWGDNASKTSVWRGQKEVGHEFTRGGRATGGKFPGPSKEAPSPTPKPMRAADEAAAERVRRLETAPVPDEEGFSWMMFKSEAERPCGSVRSRLAAYPMIAVDALCPSSGRSDSFESNGGRVRTCRNLDWSAYDLAIERRGSIEWTLFDEFRDSDDWYANKTGRVGRPPTYRDKVILFCVIVSIVRNCGMREVEGFIRQMVKERGLDWKVPDHATVSQRMSELCVRIHPGGSDGKYLHIASDGTGMKVLGGGQWKEDKHGGEKGKRKYSKGNITINVDTLEILAQLLTDAEAGDAPQLPKMLSQIPDDQKIGKFWGDGAYDGFVYRWLITHYHQAEACISLPKNAVISENSACPGVQARNRDLRIIQTEGVEAWLEQTEYHLRSLVETVMSRMKRIKERLSARKFENQVVEFAILCLILNMNVWIGMPNREAKCQ